MKEIIGAHIVDPEGNPAGGKTESVGMRIEWQNGPLGRGSERQEQNGAFVEDILGAAIDRLYFYQAASNRRFACFQNDLVIRMLKLCLELLDWRTRMREARGVEGTHQV